MLGLDFSLMHVLDRRVYILHGLEHIKMMNSTQNRSFSLAVARPAWQPLLNETADLAISDGSLMFDIYVAQPYCFRYPRVCCKRVPFLPYKALLGYPLLTPHPRFMYDRVFLSTGPLLGLEGKCLWPSQPGPSLPPVERD